MVKIFSDAGPLGKPSPALDQSTRADDKNLIFAAYMEHRTALKNFFSRTLSKPEDVSDAMQELYLRVARQKGLEEKCKNPRAYLYTVATNLLNDNIRKKYSRSLDMHVAYEDGEIRAAGISPEETLVVRQQLQIVRVACSKLSEKERRAFFMHRVNKMTYNEISKEMGVSERTIRRWTVQVLSYLQDSVKTE